MVMHSHMLNPRSFLEDCMRYGYNGLWHNGMPWKLVNAAIDTDFNYTMSEEAQARWVADTGRHWDNTQDSLVKHMKCPACGTFIQIPWTTVGASETSKSNK